MGRGRACLEKKGETEFSNEGGNCRERDEHIEKDREETTKWEKRVSKIMPVFSILLREKRSPGGKKGGTSREQTTPKHRP